MRRPNRERERGDEVRPSRPDGIKTTRKGQQETQGNGWPEKQILMPVGKEYSAQKAASRMRTQLKSLHAKYRAQDTHTSVQIKTLPRSFWFWTIDQQVPCLTARDDKKERDGLSDCAQGAGSATLR